MFYLRRKYYFIHQMPTQNISCNVLHCGNQAVGDAQRDQSFFLGRFLDKAGIG
jgi:hypothetical protein